MLDLQQIVNHRDRMQVIGGQVLQEVKDGLVQLVVKGDWILQVKESRSMQHGAEVAMLRPTLAGVEVGAKDVGITVAVAVTTHSISNKIVLETIRVIGCPQMNITNVVIVQQMPKRLINRKNQCGNMDKRGQVPAICP
jgi:hypothetical protein